MADDPFFKFLSSVTDKIKVEKEHKDLMQKLNQPEDQLSNKDPLEAAIVILKNKIAEHAIKNKVSEQEAINIPAPTDKVTAAVLQKDEPESEQTQEKDNFNEFVFKLKDIITTKKEPVTEIKTAQPEAVIEPSPVITHNEEDENKNQYVEILDQLNDENIAAKEPEKVSEIKKLIEQYAEKYFKKAAVMSEYAGGGGTNAVQYANGGVMNGDLNVNGHILSGGRDISDFFGGSSGGSQNLSFNASNADLSISGGNTVSLSALSGGISGPADRLVNNPYQVVLSSDGQLNVPGAIVTASNSKLDLVGLGPNIAYLTSTADDTTALFMGADVAELRANTYASIATNTSDTTHLWEFGVDGSLRFPDNTTQTTAYTGIPSNIAYTNQDTIFEKNVTIQGNLTALGSSTFKNTIFTTTSALSVVNLGPGPALYVYQAAGPYDVASFYDGDGIEVLHVGNANPGGRGFVGINESFPGAELTVNGAISSNRTIAVLGGNSNQWNSNWTTTNGNSAAWSNWQSVSGNYALGSQYVKLSGGTMTGNLSSTALIYSRSVLPQLPTPKIVLGLGGSGLIGTAIQYLTGGNVGDSPDGRNVNYGIASDMISIYNEPQLIVKDITEEMLSTYQIFIEMVIFKRRKWYRGHIRSTTRGMSFRVPVGNNGQKPWTNNFWTRSGGIGKALAASGIIRYNHLPVSYNTQTIDLTPCLNGHFVEKPVAYQDNTSGGRYDVRYLNCIVPFGTRSTGAGGGAGPSKIGNGYRFGYSSLYQPLYIAFRYIAWLPENNNGRGQIVDGPLSPTIRITNTRFPFLPNSYESSAKGFAVVDVNNFDKKQFICKF